MITDTPPGAPPESPAEAAPAPAPSAHPSARTAARKPRSPQTPHRRREMTACPVFDSLTPAQVDTLAAMADTLLKGGTPKGMRVISGLDVVADASLRRVTKTGTGPRHVLMLIREYGALAATGARPAIVRIECLSDSDRFALVAKPQPVAAP